MRECNACEDAGSTATNGGLRKKVRTLTGKTIWKPKDEDSKEHKHKFNSETNVNAYRHLNGSSLL